MDGLDADGLGLSDKIIGMKLLTIQNIGVVLHEVTFPSEADDDAQHFLNIEAVLMGEAKEGGKVEDIGIAIEHCAGIMNQGRPSSYKVTKASLLSLDEAQQLVLELAGAIKFLRQHRVGEPFRRQYENLDGGTIELTFEEDE